MSFSIGRDAGGRWHPVPFVGFHCEDRIGCWDTERAASNAARVGNAPLPLRVTRAARLCPGGCETPAEADGEPCRPCLLGARIVNTNAIRKLRLELEAANKRIAQIHAIATERAKGWGGTDVGHDLGEIAILAAPKETTDG